MPSAGVVRGRRVSLLVILFLGLSLGVWQVDVAGQSEAAFEDLGIPVTTASLLNYVVAPGYGGVGERF
jgi:hypothetical protein